MGNQLQPVQIGLVALFEKHATATAGPVLIGLVQFGFWSFFGPMDWTFKHCGSVKLWNTKKFINKFGGRSHPEWRFW